jgi:predicted phosphoribosyltransferase
MGAVPIVVDNGDVIAMAGLYEAESDAASRRELAEVERRRRCHLGTRIVLRGRGARGIVDDDGVAPERRRARL